MAKYFGLDKVLKIPGMFARNGGLFKSLYKVWYQDTLKVGKLVGTDKYGNKYYENPYYFFGRSRWIEYAPYYGLCCLLLAFARLSCPGVSLSLCRIRL